MSARTYNLSEEEAPEHILCPHCLSKNPPRAYICLNCFKLINPKRKFPWWKQAFQGTRAVLLLVILFCLVSVITIRRWLFRVEDRLNLIQEQNQQYHESMAQYIKTKAEHRSQMDDDLTLDESAGDELPSPAAGSEEFE